MIFLCSKSFHAILLPGEFRLPSCPAKAVGKDRRKDTLFIASREVCNDKCMITRRMLTAGALLRIMKALAIVGILVGVIVFLLQPSDSQAKTKKGPLVTEKVRYLCIEIRFLIFRN